MESRMLRMQIALRTFNNRKILVQFADLRFDLLTGKRSLVETRDELFEMYESLYKYILRVILRK